MQAVRNVDRRLSYIFLCTNLEGNRGMKKFIFFALLGSVTVAVAGREQGAKQGYEKRTFVYKTAGPDSIRSDYYRPANDTSIHPVIVWIHGGALMWGSRNSLPADQLEFYLAAGYAVFSMDYRLAPETKLAEIVEDVQDALIWVQKNGGQLRIDPRRIFVVGHSAGAYLALVSGYTLRIPPRAIVSFYGYGDIESAWCNRPDSVYLRSGVVPGEKALSAVHRFAITNASSKERSDLYVYCRQQGSWASTVCGSDPARDTAAYDRYCPLKNIRSTFPPVLLVHGDRDTDVPFEQSVLLEEALARNSVEHQFIRMSGMGHAFDRMNGGLSNTEIMNAFSAVAKFLDGH